MIRDVHVTLDIIDEPDWGNEEDEEEMPTSPTWDELIGNDPVNAVTQIFPEEQQNAQVVRNQEYFTESDDDPITLTQQMMEAWSPPDPGFNQREYSESEMEDDIANLDETFEEQRPQHNPFIDDEAAETTDEEEPTNQDDEVSDPSDCVVVAQLTEDEANAIDYLEVDNFFS